MRVLLTLLLLCSVARGAEIIQATNRIEWTNTGPLNGIIHRTEVFTNFDNTATAAQINAAWLIAPSNSVIMLTNKTFSGITKIQAYKSYVTLRGHPGETVIVSGDTATAITSQQMQFTGAANLDSGYTRGSTSVVFSASPAAGFAVGNLMLIDAADDTNQLIYVTTGPGRRMRTTHRILSVSGTTVTFDMPIPYTFTAAQTPKASYANVTPVKWVGFEDIIVDPGDSETERAFDLYGTDELWMRNVVGTNVTDESVSLNCCHRTIIIDSYFGNVVGYPNNPDGYGIYSR
jgi:hypothetical protein